MNETEFMNFCQDLGLVSDNAVTLADVAECDRLEVEKLIGKPNETATTEQD